MHRMALLILTLEEPSRAAVVVPLTRHQCLRAVLAAQASAAKRPLPSALSLPAGLQSGVTGRSHMRPSTCWVEAAGVHLLPLPRGWPMVLVTAMRGTQGRQGRRRIVTTMWTHWPVALRLQRGMPLLAGLLACATCLHGLLEMTTARRVAPLGSAPGEGAAEETACLCPLLPSQVPHPLPLQERRCSQARSRLLHSTPSRLKTQARRSAQCRTSRVSFDLAGATGALGTALRFCMPRQTETNRCGLSLRLAAQPRECQHRRLPLRRAFLVAATSPRLCVRLTLAPGGLGRCPRCLRLYRAVVRAAMRV